MDAFQSRCVEVARLLLKLEPADDVLQRINAMPPNEKQGLRDSVIWVMRYEKEEASQ